MFDDLNDMSSIEKSFKNNANLNLLETLGLDGSINSYNDIKISDKNFYNLKKSEIKSNFSKNYNKKNDGQSKKNKESGILYAINENKENNFKEYFSLEKNKIPLDFKKSKENNYDNNFSLKNEITSLKKVLSSSENKNLKLQEEVTEKVNKFIEFFQNYFKINLNFLY